MTVWGIHNDKPAYDFVEEGRIAVGWRRIGDLRAIGPDRETLKAALAEAYPDARPRAIPVWAGVLLRFAFEMEPGSSITLFRVRRNAGELRAVVEVAVV